jgi:hypothetical protein
MRKGQKYIDVVIEGAPLDTIDRVIKLGGLGSKVSTLFSDGDLILRHMSIRRWPSFIKNMDRDLLPFGFKLGAASFVPGFIIYKVKELEV